MHRTRWYVLVLLLVACRGGLVDQSNAKGGEGVTNPSELPFEALGPKSYVNKVKVLMTGLPASDEESSQGADPKAFGALVDQWMMTPQFQQTLFSFFGTAFQQKSFAAADLASFYPFSNPSALDAQYYREMFVRTALEFVRLGRPFTDLMTSNQYMVTPRILRLLSVIDHFEWDDQGMLSDVLVKQNPNFSFTLMPSGGASSIEELIDPTSANYMKIEWPVIATPLTGAQCGCDPNICGFNGSPITINHKLAFGFITARLDFALEGRGFNFFVKQTCTTPPPPDKFTLASDFNTWRLVTFNTPKSGEPTLDPWDLPRQRTASSVVLRVPRVGFFTTPAFMGQWYSNLNNQSRVTINQSLIVGLNRAFDGSDSTTPTDLRAIPTDHADPSTSCYACHRTMDPMRQYFRETFTYGWTPQLDQNQKNVPGAFGQQGLVASGGGLRELAESMVAAPGFAAAWTAKVCMWMNSGPCDMDDPEIERIATTFRDNQYDFLALVKDVAVSPLTTYAEKTQTAANRGVVISMARQEQLCLSLAARLGVEDICNLRGTQTVNNYKQVGTIMANYPSDGYSRATTTWNQTTQPGILTRIALETVCSYLAEQLVSSQAQSVFSSQDTNTAIRNMTNNLMGLSEDDARGAQSILSGHYEEALKLSGATPQTALKSTFVLSCLSPQVALIGL